MCDWTLALDFCLNSWCAASLSNILGEGADPNFAEAALEEVGQSLIEHSEHGEEVMDDVTCVGIILRGNNVST